MSSASPAPNVPSKASVVPSEVGWQFVSQYYTFVNKQPHRLHCFYTKNSTYIHGVEGEDSSACHGQQEIHNKILSIGFQDCKVFIHSVDAQSSASSGIIVQVIGEMSNSGEAWRKFAQTFFLAEQPNGYFVLNDIFRYLKEESNGDEEGDEEKEEATEVNGTEPAAPEPVPAPQLHDVPEIQPEPEPVVSLPPSVPQEVAVPEPAPEVPAVNGTHVEDEKTPEPAKETTQLPSPSPEPEPESVEEPTPVELTPAPEPAAPAPAASPAPPAEKSQPTVSAPSAPPAQPAQPPAPSAPKTWANLAAANSSKWGQVSSDARGVSAAAKPAPSTTPKPAPAPAPVRKEEPPVDTSNLSPQAQAAMAVNTAQCFVKLNDWVRDNATGAPSQNAGESVSPTALKDVLIARFGPVKELEVVRAKACAFLEFVSVDSARRAILASLPTNLGGEGGIRIGEDTASERAPRITVEMRKERGERPMSGRPPRGPSEQRGSFRGGRGGGRGRGEGPRGGAPQTAK